MKLACLFLSACALLTAQRPEITFIRQSSTLDGINEYEVAVCNRAAVPLRVDPVDVRVYALQAGISAAAHASVLKAVEDANHRSPAYYAMLVTEVASWGTTVVVALDTKDEAGNSTGPIKINSRVKALIPLGAAALSFARYLIDREQRPAKLPDNLLPLFPFTVAVGGCQSYAFFGVVR